MKEIDFLPRGFHLAAARQRHWRRSLMLSLALLCAGLTWAGGHLLWNRQVPRQAKADQAASSLTPATVHADRAAELTLQGVRLGAKPMATINGQILGLGETVEGFVVERIEPTRVTVRREAVCVTLELRR